MWLPVVEGILWQLAHEHGEYFFYCRHNIVEGRRAYPSDRDGLTYVRALFNGLVTPWGMYLVSMMFTIDDPKMKKRNSPWCPYGRQQLVGNDALNAKFNNLVRAGVVETCQTPRRRVMVLLDE